MDRHDFISCVLSVNECKQGVSTFNLHQITDSMVKCSGLFELHQSLNLSLVSASATHFAILTAEVAPLQEVKTFLLHVRRMNSTPGLHKVINSPRRGN